ncbi:MAG: response regulator [Lachnospira sp.]|nr:response regulator [Lachnospira sp.]
MYHCHLHFYFIGQRCNVFDAAKEQLPLEHFSHEFSESLSPDNNLIKQANIILANITETDVKDMLQTITNAMCENTQLILLAGQNQIADLTDFLPEITDIWPLPMQEEEIRFRLLKWQQTYKMSKDYWQTNQYFESTINSSPSLVWYKDKDGIHKKVNDSFCKTVNKTKAQVEGRDHFYIWDVDPNDLANDGYDCSSSDREVMQKKKTLVSEETVKTGDGEKLLTTYKSPLYDIDGSIMGTLGVGIDVTQERTYEQEIIKKNNTLETIFTTLDCGVLCHTIDGKQILKVNEAALKILGYESQEELVAMGFNIVAPSVLDEDKPKLRACIKTLEKKGDSVSIEYRVQHKDGKLLYIMGNVKLVEEDGVLFYQRFLLDCTAQKLKEQENNQQQADLLQALSTDYSLIFYFDLNTGMGRSLRNNDSGSFVFDSEKTNEIPLEEGMKRYIDTFVHENDRGLLRKATSLKQLRKELEEKELYYVNYRTTQNNEIEYYEMKIVRAGSWSTNHGIVLGLRNVDEETRNEMEQKNLLEEALLQANRANKAKSVFLSNMSHDIRTPMNAIIGFTTLATDHIDNKEQVREYLNKIMTSGNHLLNLINDVLDMSRIESGKMQLEEEACSLLDIIQGLRNIVQADIRAKQQELNIDMTDVLEENIYCDKLRLNQVLLNLLSNAIKYTKAQGTINLSVSKQPGAPAGYVYYEFCVKDTGIGMSKEFLSHLFEPFEREKNTTLSGIQGTGLGMAITKNIIELMNGTIEVKSELGVGTEITVTFAFRQNLNAKETEAHSEETNRMSEEAQHQKKSAISQTHRILLVEDNELNQEIAVAILESSNLEVEVAENGQIALDKLKQSTPGYFNLVLMDIQMPVMNGYEAAQAIRNLEDKQLSSIPILAMTANAFEEDKKKALQCGMDGHIAKPIDVDKLFEAMGGLLGT